MYNNSRNFHSCDSCTQNAIYSRVLLPHKALLIVQKYRCSNQTWDEIRFDNNFVVVLFASRVLETKSVHSHFQLESFGQKLKSFKTAFYWRISCIDDKFTLLFNQIIENPTLTQQNPTYFMLLQSWVPYDLT